MWILTVQFIIIFFFTECSVCTRKMQTTVDQLKTQLGVTQIRVNETKRMTYLHAEIGRIETRANSMQVSFKPFTSCMSEYLLAYKVVWRFLTGL